MTAPSDGGLRALFRTHLPGHWQSIESASTSQGIPDSSYCIEGAEGWVEFKQTHAWAVSFRTTQPGWVHQRTRAGGRVWIAVRRWRNTQETDELWMVPGWQCANVARHGLRHVEEDCHILLGGPRHWDWAMVELLLRGHG